MSAEFPQDDVCSGGAFIPCRRDPTEVLIVQSSGGFLMKLCARHFNEMERRAVMNAIDAVKAREKYGVEVGD